MSRIGKTGTLSYKELNGLDVYEFFLLLTNLEKQNKEQENKSP